MSVTNLNLLLDNIKHGVISVGEIPKEVIKAMEEFITLLEAELGPIHAKTVKEKIRLALYLIKAGTEGAKSKRLLQKMLPICEQHYPEYCREVKNGLQNAGQVKACINCWNNGSARGLCIGVSVFVVFGILGLLRLLKVY